MIDSTKSYVATRMEIPCGERIIQARAFAYYSQLSEVNLPIATQIGKTAFIGCNQIKTLELPRVTTIDDGAFQFCSGITRVDAPLATSIGSKSFAGCSSLTSVNLNSLISAGIAAFRNCISLQNINLTNLTQFNNNLLQNCSSLIQVNAQNVTKLGKNVFRGCSAIKDIILPKVTSIGNVPFHGCILIESLELPSLTKFPNGSIGSWDSTFPNLKYINLRNATSLYQSFFQGVENAKCINLSSFGHELVHAARSEWRIPSNCDVLCSSGWIDTIQTEVNPILKNDGTATPDGSTSQRTFYKTSGLKDDVTSTNIDLYDSLIGEVMVNAFKDKTNLDKVYFPIAWKIGASAFNGCGNLRQIRLPSLSRKANIGNDAFKNCTSLKYLDLGSMSKEDFQEKKSIWGMPGGCTVLCSNGVVVS